MNRKMMRDDGVLSDLVRKAIEDRFEGFELVELLDISIEKVIDGLYDEIVEELPLLLEELGMDNDDEEDEYEERE